MRSGGINLSGSTGGSRAFSVELIQKVMARLSQKVFLIVNSFLLYLPGINYLYLNSIRHIATTGKYSNKCLKYGFLPVPIHFYYPVPDIHDLIERDVWKKVSNLDGLKFDGNKQIEQLHEVAANYSFECDFPPNPQPDVYKFYTENDGFSYGCAAVLHCMIRHFKPGKIIEIGSGCSSLVINSAKMKNENQSNDLDYTIIDPYPSKRTQAMTGPTNIIQSRVELLDSDFFCRLDSGDILFIDSSHSVKIGSDVNYLILDILPRLKQGVLVHFHDIALPYEYPKAYFVNESFRTCWTEQYLLQAFLACNNHYEILFALNYIMVEHINAFKSIFPLYKPDIHKLTSSSFWISKK